MSTFILRLAAGSLLWIGLSASAASIGDPAPDFTLEDIKGKTHQLHAQRGKIVVLEWFNHGCPFVRKFYQAGHMQKLQAQLTGNDVVWFSINSTGPGRGAFTPPEKAIEQAKHHGVKASAVLLDPEGTVGKAYNARTTPHFIVIDAEGTLVYSGALDDQPTPDPDTIAKGRNYVMEAVQALQAGKPVPTTTSRAYGCGIKYAN